MLRVLVIAAAYLLGSIPFGYLIVLISGRGDVRETGSGGTGATNVSRRAGRGAGVLTLGLDAAKGAAAIVLARVLLTEDFGVNWWVAVAALAAMLGHIFPVWLNFRGGKGVATGLGIFLCLAPLAVLCAGIVFLSVVWTTRYVSLGSLMAAVVLPLCIWLVEGRRPDESLAPLLATAVCGAGFIILMHRANIGRLWRGTENKFK